MSRSDSLHAGIDIAVPLIACATAFGAGQFASPERTGWLRFVGTLMLAFLVPVAATGWRHRLVRVFRWGSWIALLGLLLFR